MADDKDKDAEAGQEKQRRSSPAGDDMKPEQLEQKAQQQTQELGGSALEVIASDSPTTEPGATPSATDNPNAEPAEPAAALSAASAARGDQRTPVPVTADDPASKADGADQTEADVPMRRATSRDSRHSLAKQATMVTPPVRPVDGRGSVVTPPPPVPAIVLAARGDTPSSTGSRGGSGDTDVDEEDVVAVHAGTKASSREVHVPLRRRGSRSGHLAEPGDNDYPQRVSTSLARSVTVPRHGKQPTTSWNRYPAAAPGPPTPPTTSSLEAEVAQLKLELENMKLRQRLAELTNGGDISGNGVSAGLKAPLPGQQRRHSEPARTDGPTTQEQQHLMSSSTPIGMSQNSSGGAGLLQHTRLQVQPRSAYDALSPMPSPRAMRSPLHEPGKDEAPSPDKALVAGHQHPAPSEARLATAERPPAPSEARLMPAPTTAPTSPQSAHTTRGAVVRGASSVSLRADSAATASVGSGGSGGGGGGDSSTGASAAPGLRGPRLPGRLERNVVAEGWAVTLYTQLGVRRFDSLSEALEFPGLLDPGKQETCWLDLQGATSEEITLLSKRLRLHPLTNEDCCTDTTREKWELFDNYLYVVLSALANCDELSYLDTVNINMLIFPKLFVSIHTLPAREIEAVWTRVLLRHANVIPSSSWVMYAMFDAIVDEFEEPVNALRLECETLDELVLVLNEGEQSDLLTRFGLMRRQLSQLRLNLTPKQEMLMTLTHHQFSMIQPNVQVYMRDVLDHVMRALSWTDVYRESLNSSYSNYLAKVSIQVARASNRMNSVMKLLSGVATIFLPLGVIPALWGMNVQVPGQDGGGAPFFFIIGAMVFVLVFSMYYCKRQGWVGPDRD